MLLINQLNGETIRFYYDSALEGFDVEYFVHGNVTMNETDDYLANMHDSLFDEAMHVETLSANQIKQVLTLLYNKLALKDANPSHWTNATSKLLTYGEKAVIVK